MILFRHDRGILRCGLFSRREQAPLPEVLIVKEHQHAHAGPFEEQYRGVSHLLLKYGPYPLSAPVIDIDDVPSDVGEAEDYGYGGIGASLSPQAVGHLAILSWAPLSADRPLCLHKKPNDKNDHQDHLAQEKVTKYVVHQA